MKFNSPLPQSLPKECSKAAKIFQTFVDTRNQGLDGVIPRSVLEHAKGFAILSVFKAGFVLSARAGSGIVIAKLTDGTWSAPSAIGTAGMGFGSQAGAEVTDFLIVLNSRAAVHSFMAAGSLTLGGNMSIALGPLGRNGEASSSVNTNGSVAMMYSYSKTRGLFGGLSVEGSVIMERQDANAQAYDSSVTVKMLLSGAVPPPPWANELIKTIENCTGLPGRRTWIEDSGVERGYPFGSGVSSPDPSSVARKKKSKSISSFPPPSWGQRKDGGSYFYTDSGDIDKPLSNSPRVLESEPSFDFPTRFKSSDDSLPGATEDTTSRHRPFSQSVSVLPPPSPYSSNPFLQPTTPSSFERQPQPGAVGYAVARFDFKAIEAGDLAFSTGDVITITEKSDRTDDWWTGVLNGKQGTFPANYVELL